MPDIQLSVGISMPDQKQDQQESKPALSVEDKVRYMLDLVESGYRSDTEWKILNRMFRDLQAMPKKSPRVQNLIRMIGPVLSKFGYHGVSSME